MTRLANREVNCGVCGATNNISALQSTSSFGVQDLDSREDGPIRWALPHFVKLCEQCGYCAPDISQADAFITEIVKSKAYQEIRPHHVGQPFRRANSMGPCL